MLKLKKKTNDRTFTLIMKTLPPTHMIRTILVKKHVTTIIFCEVAKPKLASKTWQNKKVFKEYHAEL